MRTYHSKELNQYHEYLELLSQRFPNVATASSEVINLRAILNLPKGTEHFLTDIHGEFRALNHVLRNGSGVIKRKITDVFGKTLSSEDIKELATLVYYPEERLSVIRHSTDRLDDWYRITIYRLVQICRVASSKYTRSKVRKTLPKDFAYVLEELLHEDEERFNKKEYYNKIIDTIVDLGRSDSFIIALAKVIQRLTIDHLHIVGDIYDRGPEAHLAMDLLMDYHSLDIQWGNHDILWMGAAAGNAACMSNAIRNCLRYANMSILEDGYGINLLPLATFAMETYQDDPCEQFLPKVPENSFLSDSDRILLAKMHKAITILQFKLEGELIDRHPEYEMKDRQLLHAIDFDSKTVEVEGKSYPLNDCLFPTLNKEQPSELTKAERQVIEKLRRSFRKSEKLQRHIEFLYATGSLYQAYNGNLLYHASVPMDEMGSFHSFAYEGESYSGKSLMDLFDRLAREAYFDNRRDHGDTDFLWFLWCHPLSPIFGKNKMATFERYLIDQPEAHQEIFTPYFQLVNQEEIAMKILKEFGLDPLEGHIINGHVPVRILKGESPIRAKGRLLVIDGGFSKSYRKTTGIAGYTLIYNSYGLQLAAHEPFESIEKAIQEGQDIRSTVRVIEKTVERKRVKDTDIGRDLRRQINNLEMLIAAYRKGIVKEKIEKGRIHWILPEVIEKVKESSLRERTFFFSACIMEKEVNDEMMTRNSRDNQQLKMEFVMLDELVQQDHDLRKIDKHIDFNFVYELVQPYYADSMGRPSIDPVVLFKMSLIQALYDIRSEERLVKEIHHNMAYRWFLGFGMRDKIPDHSTISHNRVVRFADSKIYENIFNEIVLQAINAGFVKGEVVYTDSTHIRANASNSKYENVEQERVIEEDESLLKLVNEKRLSKGQKPLKPAEPIVEVKSKKVSKTDPSSGYMHRDRKPLGFYHLAHGTVDSAHNFLLGLHLTPGNVHDATVYIDELDRIFDTFPLAPKYAGADAGYFILEVLEELANRGLTPVIGPRKYAGKKGKKSKYWFDYSPEEDLYCCFEGKVLTYKTTTRQGYVEYRSDKSVCANCPSREKCLYESKTNGEIDAEQTRIIRRHVKEHYADEVRSFMKTEEGKKLYQRRKETVERSFADMKELMGLRYAHYRGSHSVKAQVLITGAAYNIKKLARLLEKQEMQG